MADKWKTIGFDGLFRTNKITLADISEKTGIPFKSVARAVTSLKSKNRIVRIGGDRGGYYEVMPTDDFLLR